MNALESRIKPLARRFVWRFLEGKLASAKDVIFSEAGSEVERIAIIAEALQQTRGNLSLITWIQGWFILDSTPAEEGAAQKVIDDRRVYRIGDTYQKGDKVVVDGQHPATVVDGSDPSLPLPLSRAAPGRIVVLEKGHTEDINISRHRLSHV